MLSKRLKALRREKKLTQAVLAKNLGVTQQAIVKWESGLSLPEPGTMAKLAAFLDVSVDYLMGIAKDIHSALPFAQVPIIGTVKAGYGGLAYEEDLGTAPAAVKDAEGYCYLVVKGDSMEPFIREGDLALVRRQPTLENGDLGVVLYRDEEATLKKYRLKNGTVFLEPFNDAYETLVIQGIDLADLIIFGKVVETSTKW